MTPKQLATLIWGGTFFSKVFYTYLWYSMRPIEATGDVLQIIVIYSAIAAVCWILGVLLSKRIDNPPKIIDKMINRKRVFIKNNPQNAPLAITAISLGLIEISAVYGLVSFIMGGSDQVFFGFIGAAVVGWILAKPRMGEVGE